MGNEKVWGHKMKLLSARMIFYGVEKLRSKLLIDEVKSLEKQIHLMRNCENCRHKHKCFPVMSYTTTNEACTDDKLHNWEIK